MSHDDDAQGLLEFQDAFFHALRGNRVQSAAGFVHQEHFGFHGQGAGDAKTLLLAARKAQGTLIEAVLDFFPKRGTAQTFFDLFGQNRTAADARNAQSVGDVFKDGLWKRRGLLKDHAHSLAQLHHIVVGSVDVFSVQKNLSFERGVTDEFVHARERAQEGRLAAARRTDQCGDFVIAEFQVDIKQRLGVFVAEIDVFGTDFDFVFGFGNVHFFQFVWAEEIRRGRTRGCTLSRRAKHFLSCAAGGS